MDLFSGYSDSSNNPFSGFNNALASTGQTNNYLNNLNSQITGPQYDPFAQSGGFGAQTSYYSGLGRDYTTATGGNIYGNPYASQPWWTTFERNVGPQAAQDWVKQQTGGIGSDAGQSPGQYQNQDPVVDWNKYFNTTTSDYPAAPAAEPSSPGSNSQTPTGWSPTPGGNPDMQRLLGYTPQNLYSGGGIGSDAARAPDQGNVFNTGSQAFNPYASQPWWNNFVQAAGPQGVTDWLRGKGIDSTPSGQGGIGSDTSRDQLAWTMAQSSPYATAQNSPANGPYPNLGYNPGFGGDFAAGGMQQYNPQQMTNDLQRTLGEIGGGGRSYQQLGMSPSDWNTFSGIVGQDAANAWLQKGSQ